MAEQVKRQVAVKLRIRDINEGRYVKEEGWNPNYIICQDKRKVSRVNIIASVVLGPVQDAYPSIMIDDGTGKISVRTFERESKILGDIDVGDIILLIGRPREFNDEKYIMPEIIKKVADNRWIDVRRLELKDSCVAGDIQDEGIIKASDITKDVINEGDTIEQVIDDSVDKTKLISDMIRVMDSGNGADYEAVLQKCGSEKALKMMLEQGEIFEIRPGRLKVLE